MDGATAAYSKELSPESELTWLQRQALRHGIDNLPELRGKDLVRFARDVYGPRLSVLSSFGTESALLLSWAAEVDKNMRVLFIDTGKLFPETHAYKDKLVAQLGLTNVQTIRPDPVELRAEDPDPPSDLWQRARTQCCDLRKVRPLDRAVEHISRTPPLMQRLSGPLRRGMEMLGDNVAILNGVKGLHGGGRADAPNLITVGNRTDFSPLFRHTRGEIDEEFARRGLPQHPMKAFGYTSIGCTPATCTSLPKDASNVRSGRFTDEVEAEGAVCHINLLDRLKDKKARQSLDSSNL